MKLPNGYGSITKLSGKRRRPWMVRIFKENIYDENLGDYKVSRVVLGYYKTRKEAIDALAQYNSSPYDLSQGKITFGEIYQKVFDAKFSLLAKKSQTSYNSAFKHCKAIQDMPIRDIKTAALQKVIDECDAGSRTKDNMCTVMNAVFEYAMQNDLVVKNYTEFVTYEKSAPVLERIPYTDDEIQTLWNVESNRYEAKVVLILLYTGMRISELLDMKRECCHLDKRYLDVLSSKTKAGIRKVPIHDRILPLVEYFYNKNCEYLIVNDNNGKLTYSNFLKRDYSVLNAEFGMNHLFHDTRHTFISQAQRYRLNEFCLKRIVGHSGHGVTQNVYTHVGVPELLREINKIP